MLEQNYGLMLSLNLPLKNDSLFISEQLTLVFIKKQSTAKTALFAFCHTCLRRQPGYCPEQRESFAPIPSGFEGSTDSH